MKYGIISRLGWVGCCFVFISWPLPICAESDRQSSRLQVVDEVRKKAGAFELSDQYNNRHAFRFPKEKVTVLLFADYKGHGQLEPWIRPLYNRYGDGIYIDGVADLSAVPGFLRDIVQNAFRKHLKYPVLLDWRGTVAEQYEYQKGVANILLIDRQGDIRLRLTGDATRAKLRLVGHHIDTLLQLEEPCLLPCDSLSRGETYD